MLFDRVGWTKQIPAPGSFTICDGTVAVVQDRLNPNHDPASMMVDGFHLWSDEYAAKLDPYIRTWTDGHTMLTLFLDEFWPKWATFMTGINPMGCCSGHYDPSNPSIYGSTKNFRINAVYVTINSLQGCAEGIYHEVGHTRLHGVGLGIERHDGRLILNTPDEVYDSPIRLDKKRPMSAVIQAIYSWIIFGENDLQLAALPGNANLSARYLIGNLPKIEDGLVEIRKHVRCTPEGMQFMDGYFEWGESVVERAYALCRKEMPDFDTRYNEAKQYRQRFLLQQQQKA